MVNMLNCYILLILGLILEIFGALFVSMEAIGLKNFKILYNSIYKLSIWGRKSFFRILLIVLPIYIPFAIALFFENIFFTSFLLPLLLVSTLYTTIIDHPKFIDDLVAKKTDEKKIGPIGFVIMIMGFLLQLSGTIWQMLQNI